MICTKVNNTVNKSMRELGKKGPGYFLNKNRKLQ